VSVPKHRGLFSKDQGPSSLLGGRKERRLATLLRMTRSKWFATMASSWLIKRAAMRKLFLVLALIPTLALAAFTQQPASTSKTSPAKQSDTAMVPGLPPGVAAAMNSIDSERIHC